MSELRTFLQTPASIQEDWKNFATRTREQYSSMVPSATLKIAGNNGTVLVSDMQSNNDLLSSALKSDKNGRAYFSSVNIKKTLSEFGLIHIDVRGTIFGMNNFISSGKFLKMFGLFNNFELHYGWGEQASFDSDKGGALFSHIPCNMITFHLTYVDAFRYTFSMTLASNLTYLERNLDISKLVTPFKLSDFPAGKFDEVKTKDKNGKVVVTGKKLFTSLKKVLDKAISEINAQSLTRDGKRAIKEIEIDYGKATTDLPTEAFWIDTKSANIGDLKITQDALMSTDLWKGNLKTFLQNILDKGTNPAAKNKVTFYIDESNDTIKIFFYNSADEYDKTKMQSALDIKASTQNSVVKEISFNYDKPFYAFDLLRMKLDGQYAYGSNTKMLEFMRTQAGINPSSQSVTSSKDVTLKNGLPLEIPKWTQKFLSENSKFNITAYKTQWQEAHAGEDLEKLRQANLEAPLIQFLNLKGEMETLGFCGFVPGMPIKISDTDLLFNGSYIVNEVSHSISPGNFSTTLEMLLLEPGDAMKKLIS